MEARRKRFEELDISRDELSNIGKALQKEEFRKLFADYCEEVNNPQNKALFQREVAELEKQRGIDVTFINPDPGFVVKTSVDGNRKAFINICQNEKVAEPSSLPASQEGTSGRQWSLPFSLAPPREDLDKQKKRCSVFDVVFHPQALSLADKSSDFRRMLIDTALDATEKNCHVSLDRANLKFPKMVYKGLQQAAVVRKKIPNHKITSDDQEFLDSLPYPVEDDTWNQIQKQKKCVPEKSTSPLFCVPKYAIKYRHGIDIADFTDDTTSRLHATVPKELVVEIDLPLLKSANDIVLDVTKKSLTLSSEKPKYKLDLILPYGVDEEAGRATFDSSSRKLSLVLPVAKRSSFSVSDGGRYDSGVESDLGARPDEESDEKSPSENSDEGCDGNDTLNAQEVLCVEVDPTNRTSLYSDSDQILSNDVLYSLPSFTCNSYDNMIAFTLHVKNVEEKSMRHQLIQDSQGMQLTFTSLGGGLFPQHYALCIIFPEEVRLEQESLGFEVWDNNVVVQVQLKHWLQPITTLSVGTGLHDLQPQDFPNLAHIEKMLSALQVNCDSSPSNVPVVDLLSVTPEEVVLTLKCESQSSIQIVSNHDQHFAETKPSDKTQNTLQQKSSIAAERSLRKANVRQLSECSSDELNGVKIRSILKKRPVRSLSESNADDYTWLHRSISDDGESVGLSSAVGSEVCVADEGSEAGCETENDSGDRQKKTVRFSDVIAKQTFRPNSSILGQRKKNQRKQRNKKRAQERRASESENSEPESEATKPRLQSSIAGEPAATEAKYNRNDFMKDAPFTAEDKPIAKKILRRAPSSDTDEDSCRVTATGPSVTKSDPLEQVISNKSSVDTHGESSEDERDVKTEDCKKKKKKKGKKSCENLSKNQPFQRSFCDEPQFDSALIRDLEM